MTIIPGEVEEGPDKGRFVMLGLIGNPVEQAIPLGYCAEGHSHDTKLEACNCYIRYLIEFHLGELQSDEAQCIISARKTTNWVSIGHFAYPVHPDEVVKVPNWFDIFKVKQPFQVNVTL